MNKNSSLFRNILILAAGSGASKLAGILSIPILSRVYTPSDFGYLSVFTSSILFISPLLCLRYTLAIPLSKSSIATTNTAALCILLKTISFLVILILSFYFSESMLTMLSMKEAEFLLWSIPLCAYLVSLFELLSLIALRDGSFKRLAKVQASQSIAGALIKIASGIASIKPAGLLFGQVIQQIGGGYFLLKSSSYYRKKINLIKPRRIRLFMIKYKSFPLLRLPSHFLMLASMQAPIIFVAFNYGKETAGQLGMAITTIALPIAIIAQTTGNAYYSEISKIGKNKIEEIIKITNSIVIRLFLCGITPTTILYIYGEEIFSILLGENWRTAGIFASALSPLLLFQILTNPISNVFSVLERQDIFLKMNLIRFSLVSTVFAISFKGGLTEAASIQFYGAAMSAYYISNLIAINKTLSNFEVRSEQR